MILTAPTSYDFPTSILVGPGVSKDLAQQLTELGVKRPLLVTDRGIPSLDWFGPLCSAIRELAIFSECGGNPVESQVLAGVQAFRAHEADGIVAVGGGAACDVAKAIALLVEHPGRLFDYTDGRPLTEPIPPVLALPTTAGTGSEVGRSFVISDDKTHVKYIVGHPRLMPCKVLADPVLTLGLPAEITAATGMDALTHLIEAFLAQGMQPLCDGIALEGVHLVSKHLASCTRFARKKDPGCPEHIEARLQMLNASMMGAVAFQKGLGVTHSLAHALSTVCDLHHGLANAILLPTAMAFYATVAGEKFSRLAQAAGLQASSPEAFIYWLRTLQSQLQLPQSLRDVGVSESHFDELVKHAMADPCHTCGPRPVSSDDLRQLYTEACK